MRILRLSGDNQMRCVPDGRAGRPVTGLRWTGSYQATQDRPARTLEDAPGQRRQITPRAPDTGAREILGQPQKEHLLPMQSHPQGLLLLPLKSHWEILRQAGVGPAAQRGTDTWATFLRSQAEVLLACDFFETATLTGTRMY